MQEKFYALLAENGETVNDKVEIIFNENSIDVMEILENETNGYGETFYSVFDAYDRLKQLGAIEKL